MQAPFTLSPGIPFDSNRHYLPETLKGSTLVVNENGNNSLPYPSRLRECRGVLADGMEDVWYEYLPESYDPAKPTPLVISLHGGLMTGWGQAVYSSWTLLAEREGLICVFPDASRERMWTVEGVYPDPVHTPALPVQVPPEHIEDNHDVRFLLALIERMKNLYSIDAGRIYLHGMSMGNLMTSQFARYYGHLLAGAAGSGAPTQPPLLFTPEGTPKNRAGCLPVWQSRPEYNGPGTQREKDVIQLNRIYWQQINGCDSLPVIRIEGDYNFALYHGSRADLVFLDIKNRDHGQTLDEAFLCWDYFFSGLRREPDGSITRTPACRELTGDGISLAFAPGCTNAWHNGRIEPMPHEAASWETRKYHGIQGEPLVRGRFLCVPLSWLAAASGAAYRSVQEGAAGWMQLPDGRTLQFARGSIACVMEDTLRCMYCEALQRDGELLVPVEWFCREVLQMFVSSCNGVVYATDHNQALSSFMAELLADLLGSAPDVKTLLARTTL